MSSNPHDGGRDGCFPAAKHEPVMEEEDNFKALQEEVKYLRNLCGQLRLQNKLLRMKDDPSKTKED